MSWLVLLQDANTQWVMAGCMLLGLCSGVLGCFAFLRGRSLVGDALAHAALPGICLIYLLTETKSIGLFLLGAGLAGMAAIAAISAITRHTRIKEDTALALILSVFFGLGIVMLTHIQHSASGNQSGLDKFLFGQAASLVGSDVSVMMLVSVVLLTTTALFFKELRLLAFDPGFGRGLGFPMSKLDGLLMLMLLTAVVAGLQAVGVVLMAAMLIAPAVSARYWTDNLAMMVILAGIMGALAGGAGTLASTQTENLPTGPMIVLSASCFFLFSLLFGTRHGLAVRMVRQFQVQRRLQHEAVLLAFYQGSGIAPWLADPADGIPLSVLAERSGCRTSALRRRLRYLERKRWVEPNAGGAVWRLSAAGREMAERLAAENLPMAHPLSVQTSASPQPERSVTL